MAISAGGIGSGLPVDDIISQLMQLEQRPLNTLMRKEASYQASLSAFGQVKASLSSLQSATDAINDTAKFAGTRTSVGGDAGFTASSTAAASAASYHVEIGQLAQVQRVATQADGGGFTPGDEVGELTITFGTYSGGDTPSFVEDTERQATLQFDGGSLEDLRDAINDDETLGVKANIVFNGSEQQLVLSGTHTGADRAFSLVGTGSLAGLTYDPTADTTSSDSIYSLAQAQDARLTVDGIDITRSSNSISDVIDGVTLDLAKVTGTAASLTVASDSGAARSAIEAFVKAYNEVNSTLRDLTKYDPETRAAAILNGDSTVRGIQTQMRSLLGGQFAGLGDLNGLSELGIRFERDGTLSLDSATLNSALEDPEVDVARFFAGTKDQQGFAAQFSARLDNYLDDDTGLINGRTEGISASITALNRQHETLLARLETVEKRYRAQFTALDSMIASMNQTSTYLTQQLANLPQPGSIGRNN